MEVVFTVQVPRRPEFLSQALGQFFLLIVTSRSEDTDAGRAQCRGRLANRAKVRQMRSSQLAIARPISSGLSSCTKWRPLTTWCWLGKLLASLLIRPVMNKPGSASIKSFGSDAVFSHAE
jgi:hypothetical protein